MSLEPITLTLPPSAPETVTVELDRDGMLCTNGLRISHSAPISSAIFDAIARGQRAERGGYPRAAVDRLLDAVGVFRAGGCSLVEVVDAADALRPPPSASAPPTDARGNTLRHPRRDEWYWSYDGRWCRSGGDFEHAIRWTAPGPDKPTLPPVSCDYDGGAAARLNAEIEASDRARRGETPNTDAADLAAFRAIGLTPDQLRLCMAVAAYHMPCVDDTRANFDNRNAMLDRIEADESMHAPLLAAWQAETKEAGR